MTNIYVVSDLRSICIEKDRKMVEYLRIKRTALYFCERWVDMQTWMLNSLVDDAYQVHGLSSEERKPYLKQARVSSWHLYTDTMTSASAAILNTNYFLRQMGGGE